MAQWQLLVVSGSDARLRTVRALNYTGSMGYSNIIGKPTLVSGSGQISYTGITNKPSGLVSGSGQIAYSGITGKPSNLLSQSANILVGSIKNASTVAATQITGSFSGSFSGDGSLLTGLQSSAVTTYTNAGNNRVITSVDATSINGESNLTFDGATLSTSNLLVTGRLTVVGTASLQHANSLLVADRFVMFNSGSATGDGGFIVQSGSDGTGVGFGWDVSATRFALQLNKRLHPSGSAIAPDAYIAAVVDFDGGMANLSIHQKRGNIMISGSNAWIYI